MSLPTSINFSLKNKYIIKDPCNKWPHGMNTLQFVVISSFTFEIRIMKCFKCSVITSDLEMDGEI